MSLHQNGVGRETLRKGSSLQQYVLAHAGARLHCSLREEAKQKIQEFHRHWKCSQKDVEGLQK
jgi:hydrogenase maturation factor